jgi:hypothetical protein
MGIRDPRCKRHWQQYRPTAVQKARLDLLPQKAERAGAAFLQLIRLPAERIFPQPGLDPLIAEGLE